ncbi:MAG TPA: PIN domain-containing protein [Longilinea sp.]|nr:PIN domain-containing protein [Longilinea sp.]
MAGERFVLDTSAVLALIEDTKGAERVEHVLRKAKVFIPWVVLMEVYALTCRDLGEREADQRYALLSQINATLLEEIDEPTLLIAARMKSTRHLSFADAVIVAYCIRERATLLHKDPQFDALKDEVNLETIDDHSEEEKADEPA